MELSGQEKFNFGPSFAQSSKITIGSPTLLVRTPPDTRNFARELLRAKFAFRLLFSTFKIAILEV